MDIKSVMLGAELVLGLLFGEIAHLRADPEYVAWRELGAITRRLAMLETLRTELLVRIEMAKKYCMAGILRARDELKKRKPPYHQLLKPIVLLIAVCRKSSTTKEVDTSGPIRKDGVNGALIQEYLAAMRKLLLTTPPNTRIWGLTIFGRFICGVHEIVKGWTPDARGVFTDDLNRARHQLVSAFVEK